MAFPAREHGIALDEVGGLGRPEDDRERRRLATHEREHVDAPLAEERQGIHADEVLAVVESVQVGALPVVWLRRIPGVEAGREEQADFEVEVRPVGRDRARPGGSAPHAAERRAAARESTELHRRVDRGQVGVKRIDAKLRSRVVDHHVSAVGSVDVRVDVGHLAVHRHAHQVERLAGGVAPARPDIDALVEAVAFFADHPERRRFEAAGDGRLEIILGRADRAQVKGGRPDDLRGEQRDRRQAEGEEGEADPQAH